MTIFLHTRLRGYDDSRIFNDELKLCHSREQTVSQLIYQKKRLPNLAYIELFLNFNGKTSLENACFLAYF